MKINDCLDIKMVKILREIADDIENNDLSQASFATQTHEGYNRINAVYKTPSLFKDSKNGVVIEISHNIGL